MNHELYLRNKGIKVTKGRVTLLEILKSLDRGLSAEELYDKCKNRGLEINLSTIYRSLELFEKENIVKKLRIGDAPYIYSIKKDGHSHILQCDICDKEVKFPCPMEELEELIKEKVGFNLIEHKLELRGICEECKK